MDKTTVEPANVFVWTFFADTYADLAEAHGRVAARVSMPDGRA
jgi:hypothetical protein